MIIGIHPDRIGDESYSEKWAQYIQERGGSVRILNLLAKNALDQAKECDGVMWRWAHNPQEKQSAQRILFTIEHYLKIPVYPNFATSWHFDEKVAQYYLLKALGAPVPQTWVFWDYSETMEWVKNATYPLVYKLSVGAGSSNIIKVNNKKQAQSLTHRAFRHGTFSWTLNNIRRLGAPLYTIRGLKAFLLRIRDGIKYIILGDYPALPPVLWKPEYGYVYFQEYLPGNEYDTRVTVIGDRAFCYRRLNRPDDFRASGSGHFVYTPEEIDTRCIEIAFQISNRGHFQSMAYDFLFNQNRPVIIEISYGFVDKIVKGCPGHWKPDVNWVPGPMWPEEAQVDDFIAEIKGRK